MNQPTPSSSSQVAWRQVARAQLVWHIRLGGIDNSERFAAHLGRDRSPEVLGHKQWFAIQCGVVLIPGSLLKNNPASLLGLVLLY